MADKEICHPNSPNEEFIASAARNAVGRKPSADSACKDHISCRELTPPPSQPRVASGGGVERLGHPTQDGSSLAGHISSRGYYQAYIAP